jgi:hypothetical protein
MTDRAAWLGPANGFQPRSEPRVISRRGRYMLPRGPANAHRDPFVVRPRRLRQVPRCRGRSALHHGRLRGSAGAGDTALGVPANRRAKRPVGRHAAAEAGRFSTSARTAGAALVPSFTARIFQALPRVAHRGGTGIRRARDDGKALWGALCLSCGTSPERIEPESLTRSVSDFVHGHISWRADLLPPNRVTGLTRLPPRGLRLVNASLAPENSRDGGPDPGRAASNRDYCVFAAALPGCGLETKCVACMTPSPIGVGTETR